ncbi:hypothetical protein ABT354_03235 [Streptomyces sp. NPDC000594]|uniref:hypothetical protein n=1 Tax=Streptomyces sp. NPDC000594 TaxID=3154261 RepID=UPI003321F2AB
MAWTMATGAAVTLSWWGVHSVMSGTAYDRPRAIPISGDDEDDDDREERSEPRVSSTKRPAQGETTRRTTVALPPAAPSTGTSSVDRPASHPEKGLTGDQGPNDQKPMASASTGPTVLEGLTGVQPFTVDGGRVVFDIGPDKGELSFSTPNAGWKMDVWKHEWGIRVAFTQGDREESVFCTWHGGKPRVEFYSK